MDMGRGSDPLLPISVVDGFIKISFDTKVLMPFNIHQKSKVISYINLER